MILFEESPAPTVRLGEFDLVSRRVAVRAFPYAGEVGGASFRFDPVERRFFSRAPEGTVLAGPHEAAAWRTSLLRGPAGPVLVGPSSVGEAVRGAYLAAAEGARQSGRAVYLLEPDMPALPPPPAAPFTAVFVWFPGAANQAEVFAEARLRGIAAGWILPLVAGWTATPEIEGEAVARARASGASFLAGVALADDGQARRVAFRAGAPWRLGRRIAGIPRPSGGGRRAGRSRLNAAETRGHAGAGG